MSARRISRRSSRRSSPTRKEENARSDAKRVWWERFRSTRVSCNETANSGFSFFCRRRRMSVATNERRVCLTSHFTPPLSRSCVRKGKLNRVLRGAYARFLDVRANPRRFGGARGHVRASLARRLEARVALAAAHALSNLRRLGADRGDPVRVLCFSDGRRRSFRRLALKRNILLRVRHHARRLVAPQRGLARVARVEPDENAVFV
mmetsp:Transcript_3179/g.12769  ORF Transcript_3179/g.12769 Transcript_3179/m.12769 type:complete len:206 (-) Transcript_3179:1452-2069(-)